MPKTIYGTVIRRSGASMTITGRDETTAPFKVSNVVEVSSFLDEGTGTYRFKARTSSGEEFFLS